MDSAQSQNCGHCNTPGAVKKCSKSHTRCKEVRFCNKTCEKTAHFKKPAEKQPEDPDEYAENLLKKEVEAEMKKNAKQERHNKWASIEMSNFTVIKNKDAWKWLEEQKKNK
jgi:hypothetical protein